MSKCTCRCALNLRRLPGCGHPIVPKDVFLEYVAVQEKGDINPLMLGIIRKERFTREIILCIMKDYDELKQMYC